ncbi:hypothetical protein FRC12_001219 [Ceratobasidium sp. 428]|nr:hypothetical protein FRC12_001219 [Ceratobasidium sp. 428]
MSSIRPLTRPSTTNPKSTNPPVQRLILSPIPSSRAPSVALAPEPTATPTRRSTRARRPSSHKRESDEYQAASQETSRASTPSRGTPDPKSKSKSGKPKKKKPWGERGARPGRIVQPDSEPEPAADEGSPGPLTKAGPNSGGSRLASERLQGNSIGAVSQEEAVCRASAALGSDASKLSVKTIAKVLEAATFEGDEEDNGPGPMEVEGGSAPTFSKSTRRVVLGGGHQPPAGGVANNATTLGLAAQGQHLEVPINDSATKSEPEPEFVELGPEDSVSQRIPPAEHILRYPQPTPAPRSISKHPIEPDFMDDIRMEPDIPTDNESNSDTIDTDPDDVTYVHPLKRQRLTLPSRGPLPPRPQPSVTRSGEPSSHPAASTTSRRSHPTSSASHIPLSAVPEPPPIADLNAVLAWAARLAKQTATSQGAHVTNEYETLARVLDDLRRSQLAAPNPLKRQRAEAVEDHAAVLEAEAAYTLGTNRPRHRPTLDDYPGFRRHIATLAIPELIATSITEGGYDEHPKASRRAETCYNRVWERELPNIPVMKAPLPLLGIMTHRNSWACGKATERVRSGVISEYGLVNPPRTPEDVKFNRRLVKRALPDGFYCPNLEPGANEYEHPGLNKCFAFAFFWAADSVGAVFHDIFYPLPLPAVAMGLTITRHCLGEWKTGRFQKRHLDVDKQRQVYEKYLRALREYALPDRLRDFQKDWFWYGMDYAGVAHEHEPVQPITHTDRVRPESLPRNHDAEVGDHSSTAKPTKHHHRHHHHHHASS